MYSASADLKTLLSAHDFASNANLTVDPDIRLLYEDHPSSHSDNGLITIGGENLNNVKETWTHRFNTFRIPITIEFDGQTDDTKVKALLTEIQSAFDTENKTHDRDYYWRLTYSWSGLVRLSGIRAYVDAVEEWVAI